MSRDKLTREEMWSRQQISSFDVDYNLWERQREGLRQMSLISRCCMFTVDVFKGQYDFASDSFADIFGFKLNLLQNINEQDDLLETRIHPEDSVQLIDKQIKHSQFIYSLPFESRNDYQQTFQFRMLNRSKKYINIISRQQVIRKDRNGKAWIVMGVMDISPDQIPTKTIKHSVLNLKTGDIINPGFLNSEMQLTNREKDILRLIRQGLLSKEIAYKFGVSIYTINNHRKNILAKLNVDNAIEAINKANETGLLD